MQALECMSSWKNRTIQTKLTTFRNLTLKMIYTVLIMHEIGAFPKLYHILWDLVFRIQILIEYMNYVSERDWALLELYLSTAWIVFEHWLNCIGALFELYLSTARIVFEHCLNCIWALLELYWSTVLNCIWALLELYWNTAWIVFEHCLNCIWALLEFKLTSNSHRPPHLLETQWWTNWTHSSYWQYSSCHHHYIHSLQHQ